MVMQRVGVAAARGLRPAMFRQTTHTLPGSAAAAAAAVRAMSSAPPSLALSPEQIRQIGERTKALHEEHLRLKTDVPAASLDPTVPAGTVVDADQIRRKRLLYRSKQRGWLEVDLLLGSWAAEHVMALTVPELDEYEKLLNQETIDIFNIVNGAMAPPPELQGSAILLRLQEYAASSPFGKASAQTYEEVKDRTNLI